MFEPKETKREEAPGERSTGKMLGPLALGRAGDLGNTLIYFIQVVDKEHCLGLLCFLTPILMPLRNKKNLFIHLKAQ